MEDLRTDETLMLAYRYGDTTAFDALYRRHRGRLYRAVLHQCGSRDMADEVFQDVWMSVIRGRENYEVLAKFTTWLYGLARHRIIDAWRVRGRTSEYEAMMVTDDGGDIDFPAPRTDHPEHHAERKELATRLVEAVDALPTLQREAFLLSEEGGLSVEDVARVTGCGFETAKSRLRYALSRLRAQLGDMR